MLTETTLRTAAALLAALTDEGKHVARVDVDDDTIVLSVPGFETRRYLGIRLLALRAADRVTDLAGVVVASGLPYYVARPVDPAWPPTLNDRGVRRTTVVTFLGTVRVQPYDPDPDPVPAGLVERIAADLGAVAYDAPLRRLDVGPIA